MATQLPGVRIGPLDPDKTESFGQVSGRTSARQLIRMHSAMHPPDLIRALSLKLDEERTTAVLLSEVADVLAADGDLLPEGATLEGAQVRGERDRPQLLTFTYKVESGRTAKGYTDYDERFEKSVQRGDEAVRIAELRKTGLPLTGEGFEQDFHVGAARAQAAERQATTLREENDRLRRELQSRGTATGGGKTAEQERQEDAEEHGDNPEDLKAQIEQLQARLEEAESTGKPDGEEPDGGEPEGEGEGGEGEAPSTDASGADEPVEGYSDFNADKAKGAIKEGDEATVRAILAYESEVGKRSTVISAAEHRLDELAKAHQKPTGE